MRRLPYVFFVLVVNLIVPAAGAVEIPPPVERLSGDLAEAVRLPSDGGTGTLLFIGTVGGALLIHRFDDEIRGEMGRNRSRSLDRFSLHLSTVGDPLLHLGAALGGYGVASLSGSDLWRGRFEAFARALLVADGATLLIKTGVGRERPSVSGDRSAASPFSLSKDHDSFPSMHTASSFAVASVLASWTDSTSFRLLARVPAAAVAFSRLARDRHWGSDILPAVAIGELAGYVATGPSTGRGVTLAPEVGPERVTMNLVWGW